MTFSRNCHIMYDVQNANLWETIQSLRNNKNKKDLLEYEVVKSDEEGNVCFLFSCKQIFGISQSDMLIT